MNDLDRQITLRPVIEDDRDFLIRAYEASREIELGMTDWSGEQRRSFAELQFDAQVLHYSDVYPDASHQVILLERENIGRLYLDRGELQIAILDITIIPEYRRRGVATHIVRGILEEARTTERSVRVYVEVFNPAQEFFKGLGFDAVEIDGINVRFEWRGKA